MIKSPNTLLKEIKKEHQIEAYKIHGRYIEKELYKQLKTERKCTNCKETFNTPLYIHHKIAIRHGGTNNKENLTTVCYECHQKLDKEQEKEQKEKTNGEIQNYIHNLDKQYKKLQTQKAIKKMEENRKKRHELTQKLK